MTLPPLRQRVQTYARRGTPSTSTRTRCRFGSKRRLVATIEWLRLFPNAGAFPQETHTFDMERRLYRRLRAVPRLSGRGGCGCAQAGEGVRELEAGAYRVGAPADPRLSLG